MLLISIWSGLINFYVYLEKKILSLLGTVFHVSVRPHLLTQILYPYWFVCWRGGFATSSWEESVNVSHSDCGYVYFAFCFVSFFLYMFWRYDIKYIKFWNKCIFLMNWYICHFEIFLFTSEILLALSLSVLILQ